MYLSLMVLTKNVGRHAPIDVVAENGKIVATYYEDAMDLKATPDEYIVNRDKLEGKAKDDCLVMYALPKTDEITKDVDDTPYCAYFEEAWSGLPIRMALLAMILGRI